MTNNFPKFGDVRSVRKLDIVQTYAELYMRTLSQGFDPQKHYIDAFAGAGFFIRKDTEETEVGSALRVGNLFEHRHFIENDRKIAKQLEQVLMSEGIADKATIYREDANIAVPRIVGDLSKKPHPRGIRALVFLDPFGTHVKWSTLKKIASNEICDVVYLFPTHSIQRILKDDREGEMTDLMIARLEACMGMTREHLRNEFYPPARQQSSLAEEVLERQADFDSIEMFLTERLKTIFPYVHPQPKRLHIDEEDDLFSIFLFASTESEKAHRLIEELGDYAFNDQ